MKTLFRTTLLLVAMLMLRQVGYAQDNWPKVIVSADGTQIKIYPFQPESFSGNELKSLAAISVTKPGAHDPVFGSFWLTAKVETDREARSVTITSVKIRALKIPVDTNKAGMASLKATLINLLPSTVGAVNNKVIII